VLLRLNWEVSGPVTSNPSKQTGISGHVNPRIGHLATATLMGRQGKAFDFLALSAELRNTIYKHLVCTFVYPYEYSARWPARFPRTAWRPYESSYLLGSECRPTGTYVRTEKDSYS
jgi:hypothetical protein